MLSLLSSLWLMRLSLLFHLFVSMAHLAIVWQGSLLCSWFSMLLWFLSQLLADWLKGVWIWLVGCLLWCDLLVSFHSAFLAFCFELFGENLSCCFLCHFHLVSLCYTVGDRNAVWTSKDIVPLLWCCCSVLVLRFFLLPMFFCLVLWLCCWCAHQAIYYKI